MSFVFVYSTFPEKGGAKEVSRKLLEEELIACANIFSIDSVYRWEGEAMTEGEFAVIFKTKEELYGDLRSRIGDLHPYEVPCVTKIPVDPNPEFRDWIEEEVG